MSQIMIVLACVQAVLSDRQGEHEQEQGQAGAGAAAMVSGRHFSMHSIYSDTQHCS